MLQHALQYFGGQFDQLATIVASWNPGLDPPVWAATILAAGVALAAFGRSLILPLIRLAIIALGLWVAWHLVQGQGA